MRDYMKRAEATGWGGVEDASFAALRARLERQIDVRYILLELIGQDGAELCFRARDAVEGRIVVLVTVLVDSVAAESAIERLERWARRMSPPGHPSIPPVVNAGIGEGLVYYVVDADAQETLEIMLRREPAPEFERLLRILEDAAAALDHLHAGSEIHGDLKPTSILIDRDGHSAFLIGCGFATAMRKDRAFATVALPSPAYCAPEVWHSHGRMDARADQYSLALMALEMITGRRRAALDPIGGVVTVEPVQIPMGIPLRAGLSLQVNVALAKALSLRPALRFHSAAELVKAIRGDISIMPEGPKTEHPGLQRSQTDRTAVLPFLLLAALVIVAVFLLLPGQREAVAGQGRSLGESVARVAARVGVIARPALTGEHAAETRLSSGVDGAPAALGSAAAPAVSPSVRSVPPEPASGDLRPADVRPADVRPADPRPAEGSEPARSVYAQGPHIVGDASRPPAMQIRTAGAVITPMGFVRVTVDRGAAEVRINGRHYGRTPHVARLMTGRYVVTLRSLDLQYQPVRVTAFVTARDTTEVSFTSTEDPY